MEPTGSIGLEILEICAVMVVTPLLVAQAVRRVVRLAPADRSRPPAPSSTNREIPTVTDPLARLLSVALSQMIIVGAVLVTLKLIVDGVYGPALALVIVLAVFAYIRYTDSTLLR